MIPPFILYIFKVTKKTNRYNDSSISTDQFIEQLQNIRITLGSLGIILMILGILNSIHFNKINHQINVSKKLFLLGCSTSL